MQIASISVIDRAATPVTHNFVFRDADSGKVTLAEPRATGSYVGENQLQLSNRTTPSRRNKGEIKLSFPKVVTEVINGVSVDKVLGTSFITITTDWHESFTETERNVNLGLAEKLVGPKASQPQAYAALIGVERLTG